MKIATWTLRILAAAAFAAAGVMKLTDADAPNEFTAYGYPGWAVYVVAAIELASAAGLLFAKTVLPAAGLLIVLMLGALFTHFSQGDSLATAAPAALLLAVLAMIVLMRRRDRAAANL